MSKKGIVLWVAGITNAQIADFAIAIIGTIYVVAYFVDKVDAIDIFPVVMIGMALLFLVRLRVK